MPPRHDTPRPRVPLGAPAELTRRDFVRLAAAGAALLAPLACAPTRAPRGRTNNDNAMTTPAAQQSGGPERHRSPVVFAGHGSPMNVIEDNAWSRGFAALRDAAPAPSAVLAISAHWFVDGTLLTGNAQPRTIHDFGGFPRELYEIEYRAPGKVDLAERVRALIGAERTRLSDDWGLDHGTWSVLRWMYPAADIPVVQLSIDRRLGPREHYDLARTLSDLRHEDVLILGSGNVVHNLRDAIGRARVGSTGTPAWATRFDEDTAAAIEQRDTERLLSLLESDDGRLAHPIPDHWYPLIYAYAVTDDDDAARFSSDGFDMGSVSMRNVTFGA